MQVIDAKRSRIMLGLIADGLQMILLAAAAGDASSTEEVAQLKRHLQGVLDSGSRLAVVRS